MNAVQTQEQIDAHLEVDIAAATVRLVEAKTHEESRTAWTDLVALLRQRSWAQVVRMELERGLERRTK